MAQTTTSEVSAVISTYYDRLLLERARPYLIHSLFGQRRNVPKKAGTQIKYRRYSALSAATTPLTEGIVPSSTQLQVTDVSATVSQYGSFVEISDVVDLTTEDQVLTEAVEVLGEQLGLTMDNLVRDVLSSTASATNAASGVNGNTPTEINKADIDAEVKTMLGNNAQFISDVIVGAPKDGTKPVAPSYFGLCDTDITDDLTAVTGFKSTEEYSNQMPVMESEWGSTGRVRWLVSSEGKTTTESPVQYHCFILGKNAYGTTELEGGAARTIIKAFGSGGTADPLDQMATAGWKMFFVSRVLNDNFIRNLEVTHS